MNQFTLLAKLFPKLRSGGKVLLEVGLLLIGLILLLKNLRQDWTPAGLLPSIFVAGLGAWMLTQRLMKEKRGKTGNKSR